MPLSPEVAAILAKQLADISGAFSQGNPTQEALSGILRDRVGGLVQSTRFNRSQEDLKTNILDIINKAESPPESGVGFGTPGMPSNGTQSALTIPGTPQQPFPSLTPSQFPEQRTLQDVGIPEPGRVDPLKALGMGQQGTQEAIRLTQENRFRVQKMLEIEQDHERELKVIRMRHKNAQELIDLRMLSGLEEDVLSGRREARDVSTVGGRLTNIGRTQDLLERPTPEQAARGVAATLSQEESEAQIAETRAEFIEREKEAQLAALEGAQRTPAKQASAQRQAVFQVISGIRRAMEADRAAGGETTSDETKNLEAAVQVFVSSGGGFDSPKFQDLMATVPKKYLKGIQEQMVALSEGILSGENANLIVPLGTQPRSIKDANMADFVIDDTVADIDLQLKLQYDLRDPADFLNN